MKLEGSTLIFFLLINICFCDYDPLCNTEKLNDNFTNWMKCHMTPNGWLKLITKCEKLKIFMEQNYENQLDNFYLEDLLPDLEYISLLDNVLEDPRKVTTETIQEFSDFMNAKMTQESWKSLIFWILDYDMAMLQSQDLQKRFGDEKPNLILDESDPFIGKVQFNWTHEKYTFEEMLLDFIAK